MINAYGDPELDDSKTNNLPGLHAVMQEMRATADNFNRRMNFRERVC